MIIEKKEEAVLTLYLVGVEKGYILEEGCGSAALEAHLQCRTAADPQRRGSNFQMRKGGLWIRRGLVGRGIGDRMIGRLGSGGRAVDPHWQVAGK